MEDGHDTCFRPVGFALPFVISLKPAAPVAAKDTMSSVRRSMLISIGGRYVGIALSVVSSIVVARLLTPAEIGLVSIASALISLAHGVRDFGVGSYLVQEQQLTPQRINTAFTLTAGVGLVMAVATFLAAPWIAGFYSDVRLVEILRAFAFNFVLIPFGSTSLALLHREMRFGGIFIINMSAAVVSFGITIVLVVAGVGYMSLVWGAIGNTVVTSGMAWYLRPSDAPLRIGLKEWRRVARYGGQLTVAGVITDVAMNVNDLVIGRVMGPAPVAIVGKAQGAMNLMHQSLLGAVNSVMFASFSKTRRESGNLGAEYSRSVAMMGVAAWPFYGFLALYPRDFLRLMFGPQWDAAAPLVPIFCLAGAIAVLWKLVPSLLQAVGRADLALRCDFVIQTLRLAVLAGIVIMFRSLEGFAFGVLAVYAGSLLVFERSRRIAVGGRFSLWSPLIAKSLSVACASLSVAVLLAAGRGVGWIPEGAQSVFWLAGVSTAVLWIVALHVMRHPLNDDPIFARTRAALLRGIHQ